MRLLNIETLELETFPDHDLPPYAILSHRWSSNEVSFRQLRDQTIHQTAEFAKIWGCCNVAAKRANLFGASLRYVWIDSCCINRQDPVELSESINSMFRYYAGAQECYVYIEDLRPKLLIDLDMLSSSKWFYRGWTLQELLAPRNVVLFDRYWKVIGHKCWDQCPCMNDRCKAAYGPNINDVLSWITEIDVAYLNGEKEVGQASIACRMSWAARRQTLKEEDEAYCLQGLFGVNLLVLYGIGKMAAFIRLQEELLKRSNDQSIFAWFAQLQGPNWPRTHLLACRMLPVRPRDFLHSKEVLLGVNGGVISYSKTNTGIKIRALAETAIIRPHGHRVTAYIIKLNCSVPRLDRPLSQPPHAVPLEIALTDGTDNTQPSPWSLFYRIYAGDIDVDLGNLIPKQQRRGPFDLVFNVSAEDDAVLSIAKL